MLALCGHLEWFCPREIEKIQGKIQRFEQVWGFGESREG